MRALIVAALLAAGLPAAQAHAQTAPAGLADPEPIAEQFFGGLKRGDIGGALDGISNRSPLIFKGKADQREQFVQQLEAVQERYGPVIRWERVKTEVLGTFVRRDTYVVQHRESVMRWRFIYMKLDTGWTIANFNFDEQTLTWFG